MFTAGGMHGDKAILVVGLSADNSNRLFAGEPIKIGAEVMAEMGLPEVEVVILGGKTEDEIAADLRKAGWLRSDARLIDRREAGHNQET